MAQTIPDITVDSTAWVDLNTASGVVVGTKMQVTNKSTPWVRLYEGATAPAVTSKDGEVLTNKPNPDSSGIVVAGSLKIWAICASEGFGSKVSVQGL